MENIGLSKFLNTFQVPNYLLEYLPLLTTAEIRILLYLAFWTSMCPEENAITPQDFVRGTSLTLESVLQSTDDLMNFKFIAQTENISLDFLDGKDINIDALKERE